ncbi:MAG: hypothetical protein C4575_09870 [Desulforudis sp.]|nr:MAG: hypothetical protein C4575_09870 [Desulforudis sp.]
MEGGEARIPPLNEFRGILRAILEAERWLALLDRYKRYIEDAMATVECDRVRTINVNKVQQPGNAGLIFQEVFF